MGAEHPSGIPEVPPAAGAQTEGDETFPARASAREGRAFAETIFDQHAEEIYRYLLAWTGDSAVAQDLTLQVLRTAVARMERLAEPGADVEARLVAIARAAVARRTESESEQRQADAQQVGAFAVSEPVPMLLGAVARLDDARREVLILRQLLGHSAEHAARLLAFDAPVVEELERSACAILWRRVNHAQDTRPVSAWDELTVAAALRQGAPSWLPPLDDAAVAHLRERLLGDPDPDHREPLAVPAGKTTDKPGLLPGLVAVARRRRWLLAGCVASAVIGAVAALTIGGQAGQSSTCGGATCLVSTTASGVAGTAQTLPSSPSPQPSGPTSTMRPGAGVAFPEMTNGTPTTGQVPTTTTLRGAASTTITSRPRRSSTTTSPQQTTSSTSGATTTTGGDPTTT